MKKIFIESILVFLLTICAFGQDRGVLWPNPVANDVYPYEASGMSHGPMLGRPTSNSMRIWIRTVRPMEFKVICSETLPLYASMEGFEGRTMQEDDFTGTVDLTGLKPNIQYYYGIVIDEKIADTRMDPTYSFPSFRTLPDETSCRDAAYNPDGLYNFSFGTGFGNRQGKDRFNDPAAFYTMMETHPDLSFFLMNGDYIYEDCRTAENRPHTMDMFRTDYKTFFTRQTEIGVTH